MLFHPTAALQGRCDLDEENETWGQVIYPEFPDNQMSEQGWLPATLDLSAGTSLSSELFQGYLLALCLGLEVTGTCVFTLCECLILH